MSMSGQYAMVGTTRFFVSSAHYKQNRYSALITYYVYYMLFNRI